MKKNIAVAIAVAVLLAGGIFLAKTGKIPGLDKGKEGGGADIHAPAPGQAVEQPSQPGPEAEAEAPVVEIPDDRQQLIGVRTTEVVVRPMQRTIRTVGRVEYDERRVATVNTKYEGWIEKLHIDFAGKYVKKGAPLAEFFSPELYATQQELINAVNWSREGMTGSGTAGSGYRDMGNMLRKDAGSLVAAGRQRLKLWDLSDAQIKQIEETGRPVRTMTLFSPVSGYVVQKMALQGMRVMPGEKLFDIADLSTVWVIADVYEHDLPFIREGQKAAISLSYFPGREMTAKVDYIYPALSGETRTAKVRFTLPNPGGRLKPQMYTNAELRINLGNKLVVPEDAVIDTGVRQVVYVDKGDGNFEPREVLAGVKADGMVEVIRGLKAGEKVASAANFLIDSEAQLKGIKPLGLKK